MFSQLDHALDGTETVLEMIDAAIATSSALPDRAERAAKLGRLHALLATVLIGRTLNMGWLTYVRTVCGYWDGLSPGEPEVMADQIRKNMVALMAVLTEFVADTGVFETNAAMAGIRCIAEGKDDLVNEIRTAREDNDQAEIDRIAMKYEMLCNAVRMRAKEIAACLTAEG